MTEEEKTKSGVSRREFIAGTVGSAAVLGAMAGATALMPTANAAIVKPAQSQSTTTTTTTETSVIASKELTCDVLVVGWMGMAGLVATLHAAEQGANVIAIDKQAKDSLWIGGDMPLAGQSFHVGSLGLYNSPSVLLAQISSTTGGMYCQDVANAHVANAARSLSWLINHGVSNWTKDANGSPLAIAPTKPNLAWYYMAPGAPGDFRNYGGYAAAQLLQSQVLAQPNVTALCGTTAVRLLVDAKGRVSGVIAQDYEGRFVINAGAVILCTGGYETNKEMLTKYIGPHADELSSFGWGVPTMESPRGPQCGDGSGIKMAIDVGADTRDMGSSYVGTFASNVTTVSHDGPGIDNLLGLSIATLGSNGAIVVDKTGARMCDENLGAAGYGTIMIRNYGCVTGFYVFDNTVYTVPAVTSLMQLITGFGATVYSANTIADLAKAAGINPWLATEVTNYNAAIANSTITAIQVPRTGTPVQLSTAPFYAVPFRVGLPYLTEGGIRVNANGNAVTPDGVAIPGLYVAGAAMTCSLNGGGIQWSLGYADNLAACLIWGIIDAENAAQFASQISD